MKCKRECIELVYGGVDTVMEIVVPVHPGDTKAIVSKRQKLYALLEQERDIRVTTVCVVSFRFDPAVWKKYVVGVTVERYGYEHIQFIVVNSNCKRENSKPWCNSCLDGKACEYDTVYRYLLPQDKCNKGGHQRKKCCAQRLEIKR
jgi:hypothetical protein